MRSTSFSQHTHVLFSNTAKKTSCVNGKKEIETALQIWQHTQLDAWQILCSFHEKFWTELRKTTETLRLLRHFRKKPFKNWKRNIASTYFLSFFIPCIFSPLLAIWRYIFSLSSVSYNGTVRLFQSKFYCVRQIIYFCYKWKRIVVSIISVCAYLLAYLCLCLEGKSVLWYSGISVAYINNHILGYSGKWPMSSISKKVYNNLQLANYKTGSILLFVISYVTMMYSESVL